MNLIDIVLQTNCVKTRTEARKAIINGAIRINGLQLKDPTTTIHFDTEGYLCINTNDPEWLKMLDAKAEAEATQSFWDKYDQEIEAMRNKS